MKYIFMDTNVIIDFLANRIPFSIHAAKLFELALNGKIKIYVSAISYNNTYYIIRQSLNKNASIKLLEDLYGMTEVIDLTNQIISKSFKTDFNDYEDAIQYYCALSVPEIDLIVTRNTKDFKKSTLAVLTPAEAIASFANN